jgi:predicted flavoprotein YhiN
MSVRKAGRKTAGTNGERWRGHQIYQYRSPDVTFESEKLTKEELEKLSGEVRTYSIDQLKKKEK